MRRYEIANLIDIARTTNKVVREMRDRHCRNKISNSNYAVTEPLYLQFLRTRDIIRELCKAERKRRRTETFIWMTYYNSIGVPVEPKTVAGKLITLDFKE